MSEIQLQENLTAQQASDYLMHESQETGPGKRDYNKTREQTKSIHQKLLDRAVTVGVPVATVGDEGWWTGVPEQGLYIADYNSTIKQVNYLDSSGDEEGNSTTTNYSSDHEGTMASKSRRVTTPEGLQRERITTGNSHAFPHYERESFGAHGKKEGSTHIHLGDDYSGATLSNPSRKIAANVYAKLRSEVAKKEQAKKAEGERNKQEQSIDDAIKFLKS
jgi:hypothetical protein